MARIIFTALTVALLVGTATRATSNNSATETRPVATVTETRDDNDNTALMVAAAMGETETVRTSIADGANVNAIGHIGNTALIFAAQEGHAGIVELLVAAGADIDAANDYGTTARKLAAGYGHREMTELFEAQPEMQKPLIAGIF